MKKFSLLMVMVLVLSLFAGFAPVKTQAAQGKIIPVTRLEVGDKLKLGVKTTLKNPVWGSTDTKVATVSKKGVVKAKAEGLCYISAVSKAFSDY